MIDMKTRKEAATKAAKDFADNTVDFATKAMDLGVSTAKSATENAGDYMNTAVEFGGSAAESATEALKSALASAQVLTDRGMDKVAESKVTERAQARVDAVQEKIDVDQIQDQVAKLREQMESVLTSWKDSFRPSTKVVEAPAKKAPVKKASTKTATKKAPVKKASTKTATKKAPVKKASTEK